jgi:3-deoxy-D-manno-octulosonic-acid transferase
MGILLDILYVLGLLASSPFWLYRMVRHGRYRSDLGQRLGGVPRQYGLQPVIWIHGVSLGEVNASRALVEEIHRQLPDYRVVVSTSTQTGMEAARKHYHPDLTVFRWPLDLSWATARALRRIGPDLVVLMEGEVWPNFLRGCNRRDIPVCVVNARISRDKGYPRYKKLGPLAGWLFNKLTCIGCQNELYAELYQSLGVKEDKLRVTGMLKFDSASVSDRVEGQDELANQLGLASSKPLWVAGGTGNGEERIVLDVFRRLRESHPDLALALVPRKPERFDEVERLIQAEGFSCLRRSQASRAPTEGDAQVILGDTMGELRKFYALADVVFVGRSLVPMGGSDMIEAAALGKPTAFGPHTFNFPQAEQLARHGCAAVADASELTEVLDRWLSDAAEAADAGSKAQEYVIRRQGATRRNVEMICRLLRRTPALASDDIATDALASPASEA